ncbi:succinate dehydrogenase [ubiquinone] cytochrome b small subunit, mitochondrial [Chrysoperla carnea]|uniref:succinate dehydrogenase [ubiquinone] cytochrome b small subunit, mitochondrial n=1 Tax=Chrysoperla carnea TaxID=189513 RepID=UPI001D0758E4|nr:succinate dehydrogenase [ubiquinone] cytochrome b small subunit, mitochondrial [Chrysoperla carnea]
MFSVLIRGACNNVRATPVRYLATNASVLGAKSLRCSSNTLIQNVNKSKIMFVNTSKSLLTPKNSQIITSIRNIQLSPKRMSAMDHSKLWTIERLLAVGLLVTLPIAIAVPNPVLDTIAAISIVMHQYWGLEAICNDYVRPIVVGHTIPKVTHFLLIALTLATLGGLFYFNYNDMGLGRAIRRIWSLESSKPSSSSTKTH